MEWVTEGLIPLLGMVLSIGGVIAIVLIVSRSRQRRIEIQADLQAKLIEKFGSATELATFLQSPTGRQFVNGVQTVNAVVLRDRVAAGYARAIILSFLGGAFMIMWMITGHTGLAWPGVLLLALGLGYVTATWATTRLSQPGEPVVPQPPREM